MAIIDSELEMETQSDYKVCAGIVTYNPNIERLKENYSHISKQVDFIIICDNGSRNIELIKGIRRENRDYLIELEKNQGIAYALNRLCEAAGNAGYQWIITLDQDSVCPENMVKILTKHVSESIAIVGPRIIYKGNEKYSARPDKEIEDVEWVITSGSLTNTWIWKNLGGFDEKLFIDKVDTDYGIRANRAGYRVRRDNTICLNHELGNMFCRVLFGRTIYVTNHNPMRIYYQCRNTIYLGRKIGLPNATIEVGKIVIKIILYENDKKEKLKNAFRGIRDGVNLASNLDS